MKELHAMAKQKLEELCSDQAKRIQDELGSHLLSPPSLLPRTNPVNILTNYSKNVGISNIVFFPENIVFFP